MNPIYYSSYIYQPIHYSCLTFQQYPLNSIDYFHFDTTPSFRILQDFNVYGSTQNTNFVTNPENVKVQENESEIKKFHNHENINFDPNQSSSRLEIINKTKINQKPILDHNTVLKVKYFDPTQAPVITSSRYYNIENFIHPTITQSLKSKINQLEFVQEDSCPFIIQKHKNIKKKYKIHFKKLEQNESSSEERQSARGSSYIFHLQKGQSGLNPQGEQWEKQTRRIEGKGVSRKAKEMKKKRRTEMNSNLIKFYKQQRKNEILGNEQRDVV